MSQQRKATVTFPAEAKRVHVALWVIQAVLAALFLFAGGMKLVLPAELLKGPIALPIGFLRFIGVAEVCGALGLVLPGVLRIRTFLTALAASGLVVIMTGATVVTLIGGSVAGALVPAVVGMLAVVIAYGRWKHAPLSLPRRGSPRQPASTTMPAPRYSPSAG